MYYDEVQLTMRTGPEVLFLARKYLIPSLTETCIEFFLALLKALRTRAGKSSINTLQVSNHDSFIEIDHSTLTNFLSRDTLVAKEI